MALPPPLPAPLAALPSWERSRRSWRSWRSRDPRDNGDAGDPGDLGDPGDPGDARDPGDPEIPEMPEIPEVPEMPEIRRCRGWSWSRPVQGAERSAAGEGRCELAQRWQMESLNTRQSLPCMLMCQGGDGGGKVWDELQGSVPELPVCPSWPPVRQGQGRRDSFCTRKRAAPPASQTYTRHLGRGGRQHSGIKRNRSYLNRSFPTFFSLLPSHHLSLSPSSLCSGLPCSLAALTSPVSTPPQHPSFIHGHKLDSARSGTRQPRSFIRLLSNLH